MQSKHAVLFYDGKDGDFIRDADIMWIDGKGFQKKTLIDPCYTLRDLAEVTYPLHVTHLWVLPEYGEFKPATNAPGWRFSPYYNRQKAMMGTSVRKEGHKEVDVNLIFLGHTDWLSLFKEADAHEVLITIHYLEQVLGVIVGSSPARTGWRYLKKLHPEWVEEIDCDLNAMHFRNAAEPIVWQRSTRPGEGQYLHKWDKNMDFTASATTAGQGVGTPVHVDHGEDAAPMNDKQAVGVWRCSIKYDGSVYDPNMPPVWKEEKGTHAGSEGWIPGPIIRLLRKTGHEVTVHEGYVFPEKHNLMDQWGNTLWKFRQDFRSGQWVNKKCALLAGKAIKLIANAAIGMTSFRGFDGDDDMKRPDIRSQLIAREVEVMWHNINKIKTMYGVTPVLVYADAVYYLSDNPDGRAFLPEMTKRETQLGGFSYEGHIEMTPDVLKMFSTKMAVWKRLEVLNKIGWVK